MSDRPDLDGIDDGSGGGPVGTGGVEQRLRTQLGRHAADATVPEHGLAAIRGRIQRRRRNRQLLVGTSSLAVVLVLLVGVLSIARPTEDSQPFIDDTGTMPLLGWRDARFEVDEVRTAASYRGRWWPPGSDGSGPGVTLRVHRAGELPEPLGTSEPVTIAGQSARLFRMARSGSPEDLSYLALLWEASPGWSAVLDVRASAPEGRLEPTDMEAFVLGAAETIGPIDPEMFGAAVDQASAFPSGRSLIFAPDTGRSIGRFVVPGLHIIGLEPSLDGRGFTELCIGLADRERVDLGAVAQEVTVRDTEGEVVVVPAGPDTGANGLRTIRWIENELAFTLVVDGSLSTPDLLDLAEDLRSPSTLEWGQAFVASDPPQSGSRIYC
jgi:anti-sigma factor RsiW